MADLNLAVLYSIYALAVIALVVRLITKKKRDFLISSALVFLAVIYTKFSLNFSVVNYFLLAMFFSLIGDLLMAQVIKVTDERIVDGVMAFGIAHILYALGFIQLNVGGYGSKLFWMVPLGLVLATVLYYIIGYNPKFHVLYKVIHFVYAIIITAVFITILAFIIRDTVPIAAVIVAILGILFFMISDGVLAYNEFKQKIPHAEDIIAITYIVAQILLQLTPVMTFIYS